MAVQYEALVAGLGQRDQWHIGQFADQIHRQLADIGAGPVTTLRLVLDMLFPDTAGRQAATAIEQCVLVRACWRQHRLVLARRAACMAVARSVCLRMTLFLLSAPLPVMGCAAWCAGVRACTASNWLSSLNRHCPVLLLLLLVGVYVFVCLQNTPWAQSQAYQAALVQDTTRNPASLTLVGRGDPTGRGHGFSFIRDDPKKAKDEAAPPSGLQAQADGTITGAGRVKRWSVSLTDDVLVSGRGQVTTSAASRTLFVTSKGTHCHFAKAAGDQGQQCCCCCLLWASSLHCYCKASLSLTPLPAAAWRCAGTGADLRRLSNKRAGEILETKFGLDPAVVQTIARWDRIDLIRT